MTSWAMQNIALLSGSTGGFNVRGCKMERASWMLEYDANGTYVNKPLFEGSISASDNIDVHETADNCVHFGFRNVSYKDAGYHLLYNEEYDSCVGAFLQVVSPSQLIHEEPRSYRFEHFGLMDYDHCHDGPDYRVTCSCVSDGPAPKVVTCRLLESDFTPAMTALISHKCFSHVSDVQFQNAAAGEACSDEVVKAARSRAIAGMSMTVKSAPIMLIIPLALLFYRALFGAYQSSFSNSN